MGATSIVAVDHQSTLRTLLVGPRSAPRFPGDIQYEIVREWWLTARRSVVGALPCGVLGLILVLTAPPP